MNRQLWQIIAEINAYLKPLRALDSSNVITMNELVELRSKLRVQLENLRNLISEHYTERDAYYVLFPLTAHCDELLKKIILDRKQLEWPSLQQELYQVADDAGDLFYELLDNALKELETLSLVYEVYYFCLNDGFVGRYAASPDRLEDYIEKLRNHIHVQPITQTETDHTPPKKKWLNFRIRSPFYYGSVSLILVLLYFFLMSLANSWQHFVIK